jgi:hypothetical protein
MKKTQEEIERMKVAILRQKDSLSAFSLFGTPNHEIAGAQIEVLDGVYSTEDQIYDRFGSDSTAEEYDASDDEMANDIIRALEWKKGNLPDDELVDEEYLQAEK